MLQKTFYRKSEATTIQFHFIKICLSVILCQLFEAFVAKRVQRKEQGPATILLKKTDAVSPEMHEIRY